MKKDFLSLADLSKEELLELLEVAATQRLRVTSQILKNRHLALYFEKPSLRTKASFETGIGELSGTFSYFSATDAGKLGERESAEDLARTMNGYFAAIIARVHDHIALEKFAAASDIPVINALSDREHPCQVLADLLTIRGELGRLDNFKLAFLGDGNNVALSLALAAEILGFEFMLAGPAKYQLKFDQIKQSENINEVLANADVVYTDSWTSMGDEAKADEREATFRPFQLNADALKKAKPSAIVMHCLPAHRGEEITNEVIDSKQSIVFEQAANRLPAQKALLIKLFSQAKI
ncbi:ornithine carbamoyltransferase [Candidatus Gracilibacteria bacterium]|nr:ornithine carbamoyltransferase [Candidatus Gracilibacteria bacterium]MCF7856555.1 ornithine carbamoyltransferase [Candidatus Gracilibacteria bacterium]MCF7896844.1 ornithine carbamoyltransferase [Candidatus Gracilibacteria bacterium]